MSNIPLLERLRRNRDWYDIGGPSQSPTVILIHGSTLTRHAWRPQVNPLTVHYQVITLDLPGHGALAAFPFTLENSLLTLNNVIETTQSLNPILVGASLGGHIATLYASRYTDRIAGLGIAGASMNFHGLVGGWTRLVGKLMPRLFSPDYLRRMGEQAMRKKWPADTVADLLQSGVYPEGAFLAFRELPDYDFKALIKTIRAPILIVNGENDRPNRKQEQEFLRAAPNSRLKIIDGAGHACAIEKPEAFTQALLEFARQVFQEPDRSEMMND